MAPWKRISVSPWSAIPELPRYVASGRRQIASSAHQFIGNAIKYTNHGGVKLRARLAESKVAETGAVRFEVEDSGPGIGEEDRERIFSPIRAIGERAPAETGTGLGLAISKQYVELMGGKIGVASKLGKGSVFYFEIPVSILAGMAERRADLRPRRIIGIGQRTTALSAAYRRGPNRENRLLLRKIVGAAQF